MWPEAIFLWNWRGVPKVVALCHDSGTERNNLLGLLGGSVPRCLITLWDVPSLQCVLFYFISRLPKDNVFSRVLTV